MNKDSRINKNILRNNKKNIRRTEKLTVNYQVNKIY